MSIAVVIFALSTGVLLVASALLDDFNDRLPLAAVGIVSTILFGIVVIGYIETEAKPKIAYTDCIIEHQSIDYCDVLMPKQEGTTDERN